MQEVELGFISGACGGKKSLENKFVSMNEKVLSDGASFLLILNVRCQ